MIVGKREIFPSQMHSGGIRTEKPPVSLPAQDCAEQIEGLKKEVERLKEILKKKQQCDKAGKR